jgi:hypothetical protein
MALNFAVVPYNRIFLYLDKGPDFTAIADGTAIEVYKVCKLYIFPHLHII